VNQYWDLCAFVFGLNTFILRCLPKKKKKKKLLVMGQSMKLIAKKNSECPQLIKLDHKGIQWMVRQWLLVE